MDLTGISSIFDLGSKLLDRFVPDPTQKAQAALEMFKAQQAGEFKELDMALAQMQAQTDTNKVEAASPDVFVSGWRPGIGWACVAAFSMNYVIGPMGEWLLAIAGHPIKFPQLDVTTMMPVLMGMLGLGGYRTYEKIKGVA